MLNGAEHDRTGSLLAGWIDVGATGLSDEGITVLVRRDGPGVEVIDDWDGFGQILTAWGTTTSEGAAVGDNLPPKSNRGKAVGRQG